jgi:hypothetical protein
MAKDPSLADAHPKSNRPRSAAVHEVVDPGLRFSTTAEQRGVALMS